MEGPDAAEMVSVAPRLDVRVTVFPGTPIEMEFSRVTVTVEVVTPSAVMEVGDAETVETVALGRGETKATVAVWVMIFESVESTAVYVDEPTVDDLTVKVTTPLALDGPEAAEIVSIVLRLE